MMNENKTAMLIREADFFEEFYEQYHIYVYKLVKEQCWRPEDVEYVDPSIRELLERKYLLEESDSDIAAAMQIKTNSVRIYLSRARKAARSVLQPYSEQLGK